MENPFKRKSAEARFFENINREKPELEKTIQEQAVEKNDRRAKVALGALGAALAVDIALQPELPPLPQKGKAENIQQIRPEESAKQQIEVPGATIDLKANVIHMKPPGDVEPKSIDLSEHEKVVRMKPPEG